MLGGVDVLLQVCDVHKEYRASMGRWGGRRQVVKAVDGVSCSVRIGDTFGLVGESGSGKSTLARLIMLIDRPTSGSIVFAGKVLTSAGKTAERWYRSQAQMVMQDPFTSLDPRMRVEEIVAEPLIANTSLSAVERRHAAHAILERVGLQSGVGRQFPHQFSGGQRQRIAIARALVLKPRLLVLDEPVGSLDVSIRSQVLNLLRELRKDFDVTYFIVSHDLGVVHQICTQVAVMHDGKIVESGDITAIFGGPQHPYTKALMEAIPDPFGAFSAVHSA